MREKIAKTIEDAADLIEKGWVQGSGAVDDEGNGCHSLSDRAVAFCIIGAINRVCQNDLQTSRRTKTLLEENLTNGHDLVSFNDHGDTTKEMVLKFMRKVAKSVRKGDLSYRPHV
jgi:hypothetical protein